MPPTTPARRETSPAQSDGLGPNACDIMCSNPTATAAWGKAELHRVRGEVLRAGFYGISDTIPSDRKELRDP
jgi:hypothetical protein